MDPTQFQNLPRREIDDSSHFWEGRGRGGKDICSFPVCRLVALLLGGEREPYVVRLCKLQCEQ